MKSIRKEINNILHKEICVEYRQLTENANFHHLGLEEDDINYLLIKLEEKYNVLFDDFVVDENTTINDLVEFINKYIN